MRFVTYRIGGEPARPGVIEGDSVRTITTATLREYIALAPHERIAWHAPDELDPAGGVELDAPVRPPRNVFCVGRNYLEHAKEGARAAGRELKLPSRPTFFTKAADGDRRSRRDAASERPRFARVRLRGRAGRRHRRALQRSRRERRAARYLRIYRAQRRHRARSAARTRPVVQRKEPRSIRARSVRGS